MHVHADMKPTHRNQAISTFASNPHIGVLLMDDTGAVSGHGRAHWEWDLGKGRHETLKPPTHRRLPVIFLVSHGVTA